MGNFGNDSRYGHDSKFDHKNPCKICKSHDDSACKCNFKAPARELAAPLNSDCVLVNSVVGSKTVQKVAEATFPFIVFTPVIPSGSLITNVVVTPNLAGIVRNTTIIRDKVVNIGIIPVTITVTSVLAGDTTTSTLTTNLPFQEHTDFPGACPEDTVIESPFVVEGTFFQQGVPFVVFAPDTFVTLNAILVKLILRTTITVTRQVIVDSHGGICDVNDRRCESPTTPPTSNFNAAP